MSKSPKLSRSNLKVTVLESFGRNIVDEQSENIRKAREVLNATKSGSCASIEVLGDALRAYSSSIDFFQSRINSSEVTPTIRKEAQSKIKELLLEGFELINLMIEKCKYNNDELKRFVNSQFYIPKEEATFRRAVDLDKDNRDLRQAIINQFNRSSYCLGPTLTDISIGDNLRRVFELEVSPQLNPAIVSPTAEIPGILLYGPTGTGKTLIAESIVSFYAERGLPVVNISLSASAIKSPFIGVTAKNIDFLFKESYNEVDLYGPKNKTNVVIFLDEFDGFLFDNQGKKDESALNQFKNNTSSQDHLVEKRYIYIITSTNNIERFTDQQLSRIPKQYFVGIPGFDEVRFSIQKRLSRYGLPALNFIDMKVLFQGEQSENDKLSSIQVQRIDMNRTKLPKSFYDPNLDVSLKPTALFLMSTFIEPPFSNKFLKTSMLSIDSPIPQLISFFDQSIQDELTGIATPEGNGVTDAVNIISKSDVKSAENLKKIPKFMNAFNQVISKLKEMFLSFIRYNMPTDIFNAKFSETFKVPDDLTNIVDAWRSVYDALCKNADVMDYMTLRIIDRGFSNRSIGYIFEDAQKLMNQRMEIFKNVPVDTNKTQWIKWKYSVTQGSKKEFDPINKTCKETKYKVNRLIPLHITTQKDVEDKKNRDIAVFASNSDESDLIDKYEKLEDLYLKSFEDFPKKDVTEEMKNDNGYRATLRDSFDFYLKYDSEHDRTTVEPLIATDTEDSDLFCGVVAIQRYRDNKTSVMEDYKNNLGKSKFDIKIETKGFFKQSPKDKTAHAISKELTKTLMDDYANGNYYEKETIQKIIKITDGWSKVGKIGNHKEMDIDKEKLLLYSYYSAFRLEDFENSFDNASDLLFENSPETYDWMVSRGNPNVLQGPCWAHAAIASEIWPFGGSRKVTFGELRLLIDRDIVLRQRATKI